METETIIPKKGTGLSTILAIIILTLLSAALLAGLYFLFAKQSPDVAIKNGDSVITQIKTLSRYESSEFTIEKIIEAGSGNDNAFKEVLFGDKILLIANGKVTAGFDFSKLNENDIKIEGNSITLTLPAPQILTARLDNEKTRVYDRQQGLLTQGNKDLETEARLSAENSIRIAACEGGILQNATDNARTQLTALIKALGYSTVVINIPSGNC